MLWTNSKNRGFGIFSRAACPVVMAALVLSFSASHAYADAVVLPGLTASVQAQANPLLGSPNSTTIFAPPETLPLSVEVSADGTEIEPGHGFAMASVNGGLDPTLSVSVSATGDVTGSFIAGASAVLRYSFEIVGPTTANSIPVIAQGNSSISQITYTGFQTVQISTTLNVNNGSVLNETGGPFDTTINLQVGTVYNVYMMASAVVQVDPDEAEATAFVDPSFTVDPSVSDTYSIVYSPGLLDAPEPGSLLLIVSAVAGMLLSDRRAKHLG